MFHRMSSQRPTVSRMRVSTHRFRAFPPGVFLLWAFRDPSQARKTTYDNIQDIYRRAGYDTVPQTYFHNLSGNNRYGHQADKDRKGCIYAPGFHPGEFQVCFVGNLPAQVEALRPEEADFRSATPKTGDLETWRRVPMTISSL